MHTLLLAVAVLWGSSSVAVAPCNNTLINEMKKKCQPGGPPPLLATGGLGTHIVMSVPDRSDQVYCILATQFSDHSDINVTLKNGSKISYTMKHEVKKDHLLEYDSAGNTFHLYITHNKFNVYGYTRCIPEGSTAGKGTGTVMVDIAIACSHLHNKESLQYVEEVKKCFLDLGIHNFANLTPCQC